MMPNCSASAEFNLMLHNIYTLHVVAQWFLAAGINMSGPFTELRLITLPPPLSKNLRRL